MGYMGLGYQKWVSHFKARTPFTYRDIPIHTDLPHSGSKPIFSPKPASRLEKSKFIQYTKSFGVLIPLLALLIFSGFSYFTKGDDLILDIKRRPTTYSDYEVNQILFRSVRSHIRYGNFEYGYEEIETLYGRLKETKKIDKLRLELSLKEISVLNDSTHYLTYLDEYKESHPRDSSIYSLIEKYRKSK